MDFEWDPGKDAENQRAHSVAFVVESAVANFGGNGGCVALEKLANSLVTAAVGRARSRQSGYAA